jgi:MAF protein
LLLPLLGFPCIAISAEVDERPFEGEPPGATALRLAEAKARAGHAPDGASATVAADTIVVLDGQQLGKPASPEEARTMLLALRKREHAVVSGVAVLSDSGLLGAVVQTVVRMRAYTDDEVERYVRSGRPLDKAGAYAIQDSDFGPVERLDGCYLNVVGLPLCEVARELKSLGWPLPEESLQPPCRLCAQGSAALGEADASAS